MYPMYPHIICFCGRSLGEIYHAFTILQQHYIREALIAEGIDPQLDPTIIQLTNVNVDLRGVFEAFSLADCCKLRITSQRGYYDGR